MSFTKGEANWDTLNPVISFKDRALSYTGPTETALYSLETSVETKYSFIRTVSFSVQRPIVKHVMMLFEQTRMLKCPGERVTPYVSYIGMSGAKGYGF